jgi:Tetratricopeptide repeat
MHRLPASYFIAGLLTLLIAWPAAGQKSGPTPPSRPPSGTSSGTSPGQPSSSVPSSVSQMQTPLYVNGRVLVDGQPVPEPVSVGLNCGTRSLQVIHTDMKGYFQFTLGAGPQGNMDVSASDQTPVGAGMNLPNGMGGYGAAGGLTGCELQISVAGYQPLTDMITSPAELRTIDVGVLQLRRIAGASGSAISVTSLLVPNGARKEFNKGAEDARNNKMDSATQHLEKAVAEYDKYAAAWNELGKIYAAGHQPEKARQAFEKAVAVDPKYIPPYVSLATLSLENQEYESALEATGKALDLDPSLGAASFLQAAANLRLNRLDDAEKSGREAEKGPHQNFPQLHAILADVFIQKQDYPHAAAEMRAYVKEAPKGPFAEQMRKNLEEIDKSMANSETGSHAAPQPETAP